MPHFLRDNSEKLTIWEEGTEIISQSIANKISDMIKLDSMKAIYINEIFLIPFKKKKGNRSSRLTFSTNMISLYRLRRYWWIDINVNMIYMMSLPHLWPSEIIDNLYLRLIPFEIMTVCDFSTLSKKRQDVSLIPQLTKPLI